MKVYKAINNVQADLSVLGITKDRRNMQGSGYNFRGIDDVYNTIAPLLAKHGLCILPRVLSRECVERVSQKGGALFYVTVDAEFDFVSAEDGTKHTVKTFGEAMDSGDKATNKAMSAAYKYACFQAFSIPTESDNDADAHTHTPAPKVSATKTDLVPPSRMAVVADVAAAIDERMSA
ncbi:MAG: single-stranded DNA-binding protein, partial [Caulobacteraceae bacterium]|nr:single-stranded DNA-binding protein [Caulobacteraceae bacterium]